MKKIRSFIIFTLIIIISAGCSFNKEYDTDEQIELKGKISTNTIVKDGVTEKVNILNLEDPIIVNDKKINRIELSTDKELKDGATVSITGSIKEIDGQLNLGYILDINFVDDVLSYVNSFSNDYFSMTIPTDLIEKCTVKEIENGFVVYSTSNMDSGGEVFRIYSLSNSQFEDLVTNQNVSIEKIDSDKEKTIIIMYPTTNEYNEENKEDYETIANSINSIKDKVKIK